MTAMNFTENYKVISRGYTALGHADQSEGRGGLNEIGDFTEVNEAIEAARGRGVQGSSGEVDYFEWRLHDSGLVERRTKSIYGHRRVSAELTGRGPEYLVGWHDFREYGEPETIETPEGGVVQ